MEALQTHMNNAPAATGLGRQPAQHGPHRPAGQGWDMDALVLEHRERVLRHCTRRGLNPDDAADVTQEVFIKVMRNIDRFDGRYPITTWIYRITENAVIDHIRYRSHRPGLFDPKRREDESMLEPAAASDNPEQCCRQTELWEHLVLALEHLPKKARRALELKEFEGWTYEEIARDGGCTRDAVKTRVHRARKLLMERLAYLK